MIHIGFRRSLREHTIRVLVKEVVKVENSFYYSRGMGIKIATVTNPIGDIKPVTVPFKRPMRSAQSPRI